jgi:hypothetical protein
MKANKVSQTEPEYIKAVAGTKADQLACAKMNAEAVELAQGLMDAANESADSALNQTIVWSSIIGGVGLLTGLICAWSISCGITVPVMKMVKTMGAIAEWRFNRASRSSICRRL